MTYKEFVKAYINANSVFSEVLKGLERAGFTSFEGDIEHKIFTKSDGTINPVLQKFIFRVWEDKLNKYEVVNNIESFLYDSETEFNKLVIRITERFIYEITHKEDDEE